MLVCATRDADKEVFPGFANIAGVDCPGFFDRINLSEVLAHDRLDALDFTTPTISAKPCQYRATLSQKRGVFDEGRVWILIIRPEAYELQAARFERCAICLMLSKNDFLIWFS